MTVRASTMVIVGTVLTAVSCGGGQGGSAASSSSPAGPPAAGRTTPAGPPASGPSSPAPATRPGSAGRCTTAMLTAGLRAAGPAAGHRYAVLSMRNGSGQECRVHGYAGMRLLGDDGRALPTTVVRERSPAPGTVVVKPGAGAWAMVRWTVVPSGGEPSHGPCRPAPRTVWITPPDERAPMTIPWNMGPVCASGTLWITAFAAGTGPT